MGQQETGRKFRDAVWAPSGNSLSSADFRSTEPASCVDCSVQGKRPGRGGLLSLNRGPQDNLKGCTCVVLNEVRMWLSGTALVYNTLGPGLDFPSTVEATGEAGNIPSFSSSPPKTRSGSHIIKDERSVSCSIWQAGVELSDSSDLPAPVTLLTPSGTTGIHHH